MNITMYTTPTCGACKLVKQMGVVEELNIKVIDVEEHPELKPDGMLGAPFFVKKGLTEGGSERVVTHTGFANVDMLQKL